MVEGGLSLDINKGGVRCTTVPSFFHLGRKK